MDTKLITCIFFLGFSVAHGAFPALDVIITNGLSNSCTTCVPKGCVVNDNTPLLSPLFFETEVTPLVAGCAVYSAISYSRYHLADTIGKFRWERTHPALLSEMVKAPLPYSIDGICLTNMSIRVFPFSIRDIASSNELTCILVSFFRRGKVEGGHHLYSLYVNDATGNIGFSIQECSSFMPIFNRSVRYPFLTELECELQQKFLKRRFQLDQSRQNHHTEILTKDAEVDFDDR